MKSGKSKVFRHQSAQATCRPWQSALAIEYSGVIGLPHFHALDRLTLPHRLAHRVSLERMSQAITLPYVLHVNARDWPRECGVSVVIVRDDQYEASQAFCCALGLMGVTRVTFRESQTDLALALVDRLTG